MMELAAERKQQQPTTEKPYSLSYSHFDTLVS